MLCCTLAEQSNIEANTTTEIKCSTITKAILLPLTQSSAEAFCCPTGLKATQEYVPVCSRLTARRIKKLILESTLLIVNFEDDIRGISSLYHCSVTGSSPVVTVQVTWSSCPSWTSVGNVKGKISGFSAGWHYIVQEKLHKIKSLDGCLIK